MTRIHVCIIKMHCQRLSQSTTLASATSSSWIGSNEEL